MNKKKLLDGYSDVFKYNVVVILFGHVVHIDVVRWR